MKKSDVLNFFQTQQKVAASLTEAGFPISQAAVSKWGDNVPPLRAYQLERITNGKLMADDSQNDDEQQAA
ncbi:MULTISPECIES: Cro/CI family transcriptional regulator [Shewanella]|uniref:Cro/CI family transcriptional regulator n=1 Tax=Shewanella TaxID=22 RepID=UPI00046805C3|nr:MULTISPECIES: Cro/CI family transcriptional regulator [Shewanella]NJI82867.1 Cro/Cl family transcriptional regulator [Shewanella sp. Iso12]NKZ40867.1 Cro/Cl family transcriptional regulator [Shewanella algae]QTE79856.1 Cro/Cl family transcriptional regulator [Shewanella algae]